MCRPVSDVLDLNLRSSEGVNIAFALHGDQMALQIPTRKTAYRK